MLIYLYKNISERNSLNKELLYLDKLEGELVNDSNVVDVSINVSGKSSLISQCNYIYIPDFNRYYFVNNVNITSDVLFNITAHVDVLYTYRAQIRNNKAVISKQENNYNLLLNDTDYKSYENCTISQRKFPNGFTDSSYILLTGY